MTSTFTGGPRFHDDQTLFKPEVTRDPNFLEGHYFLGNYFVGLRNYDAAKNEFETALSKTSKPVIVHIDIPSVKINLAQVRIVEGRLEEADQLLREAGEENPTLGRLVAYNRAIVAYEKKDWTAVERLLESYSDWTTSYPYTFLAESLSRLGKHEASANALEKSIPFLDLSQVNAVRALIETERMSARTSKHSQK